jgi:hypothetical protein
MTITIAEVIEQFAALCDERERANLYGHKECAAAIRALKQQYEGCIVAEGEVERHKPVAHSDGTDLSKRWEYIPLYRAREAK